MLSPRHVVIACIVTLVVNATGLLLLLEINEYVQPRSEAQQVKTHSIDFTARKKKRRPRKVRRAVKRVALKRQPLPVPDLPSSITAPGLFMPDVAATSLIKPVLDDGFTKNSRLLLSEAEVDVRPKPIHRVAPEYPEAAADNNTRGEVLLEVIIDRQGRVTHVKVLRSSPHGVFDASAKHAMKRWTFSPAKYEGRNVRVRFRQRLVFNLQ